MDKAKIFAFVFFLLFSCRNNVEAKKLPALLITLSDDTIPITLDVPLNKIDREPAYHNMHWGMTYFDSTGVQQSIKPGEVAEVQFEYRREKIRMVSVKNDAGIANPFHSGSQYFFLLLIKDGSLRLLKYYPLPSLSPRCGVCAPSIDYILQKHQGTLTKINWDDFRDSMSLYFADCPELAIKIKQKTFRSEDIEDIVGEYNRNCL
ncbi:MAG: hypothetical protein IPP77_14870 [Bacteroidetes bacterium]|nr:hypothetical protein [Bacteroidota bacterium]